MNKPSGLKIPVDSDRKKLLESGQLEGVAPAWILGSSVNSLSFVRSLGRRKIPCVVIDSKKMIAADSRYARFACIESEFLNSDEGLAFLIDSAKACASTPVLFATSDSHNEIVSRYYDQLAEHFRLIVPELATMQTIIDKKQQYAVAERVGTALPKCLYPGSENDFEDVEEKVGYPCIIKPCIPDVGRKLIGGRKVRVINNREELKEEWLNLGAARTQFMVQEIIPGGDDRLFGYLAFWSHEGEEVAWVTKQKLRQNPPIYGDGSLQRTVHYERLREVSVELLTDLNYRGYVSVEFKEDPRDGELRLMEINPRTVSGNQITISSGVDLPWIGYCYLTQKKYRFDGKFKTDVYFVNEDWDFRAYVEMRRNGDLNFFQFINSLFKSKARAIWAWDDPRPMWTTISTLFKQFSSKLKKR